MFFPHLHHQKIKACTVLRHPCLLQYKLHFYAAVNAANLILLFLVSRFSSNGLRQGRSRMIEWTISI